ncbi:uncharacterized protein [Atheta coriaria]|uniref:uncharacterized protein n=1 Tax=Dalotia coriaria TaxID=877792 RepID=UPI0031F3CB23
MGSELNLLMEFSKSMNLKNRIYNGYLGSPRIVIGLFDDGNHVVSYPVSKMDISFLVPKPVSYIDWLALVQVFKLQLWMWIISCFVLIAIFFWIENTICVNANCPNVTDITGLFFLQGLNDCKIPPYLRARSLIATLLTIAVLYSAVFSSGIVDKLMTIRYRNDIRTIEDLANSELRIEYVNDPNLMFWGKEITEAEKRAFSHYGGQEINIPYTKKAMGHYITATKLSTAIVLRDPLYRYLRYVKTMDYTLLRLNTCFTLIEKHYTLYLPLINDYILRCQATGLMTKWEWDAFRAESTMNIIFAYLDKSKPPIEPIKLQFEHVKGVFALLIVGIIISVWMFILETVWAWLFYNIRYLSFHIIT